MPHDFHRTFQSDVHIFADRTLPDLPQRLKTFSLFRVIFAVLASRVSARIADAAVALCNVSASVYDRFDIVCVEDDIVSELELAAEVRYGEVYSAAASASINNCKSYRIFFTRGKLRTLNVKRHYLQLPLRLRHLLWLLSLVQPRSILWWRRLRRRWYTGKNIHGIRHLAD